MCYDLTFISTVTQLTMIPCAAPRCGYDTTTFSDAASGLCDPWRWLSSPGRLQLRLSTLLTHQRRVDPPRLLPSTGLADAGC